MTIVEIGVVSEIAASIAVVITLIFLIVQMRQNTKMLIRANARQTSSDHRGSLENLLNKDVSELFLRGNNDGLAALSLEERYRFDLAYTIWLQSCEQAYADYKEGVYPTEHLVAYENAISGFLSTPGGKEWWAERQVWFSHQFRQDVDGLLARNAGEALKAGPPSK